jgi:polyisoprenoid-binding protein YceI
MTNYRVPLAAAAMLFAGACDAANTPAPKPVVVNPAGTPVPAATTPPATVTAAKLAAASAGSTRWVQAPGSTLTFTFDQAGAASKGSFKQFSTELVYDEKSPATGQLNVKIQIGSIDTQDQERNETLAGSDLFDTKKFPTAQYSANSFARTAAGGLEAVGKLTIRGVTHDLRLPLKIVPNASGLELSGATAIKRLDYGVGQGDWQSTEGVADEVKVQYKVALTKAK